MIFTCLGFMPAATCPSWLLSICVNCCFSLRRCRCSADVVAGERIGRRVVGGAKGLDDLLHFGRRRELAVGKPLADLVERTDRDDALRAVVKFVGFVTVLPQLLGQQVRVLGRFDQRVALVSCPTSSRRRPFPSVARRPVCRIVLPRNVATCTV